MLERKSRSRNSKMTLMDSKRKLNGGTIKSINSEKQSKMIPITCINSRNRKPNLKKNWKEADLNPKLPNKSGEFKKTSKLYKTKSKEKTPPSTVSKGPPKNWETMLKDSEKQSNNLIYNVETSKVALLILMMDFWPPLSTKGTLDPILNKTLAHHSVLDLIWDLMLELCKLICTLKPGNKLMVPQLVLMELMGVKFQVEQEDLESPKLQRTQSMCLKKAAPMKWELETAQFWRVQQEEDYLKLETNSFGKVKSSKTILSALPKVSVIDPPNPIIYQYCI